MCMALSLFLLSQYTESEEGPSVTETETVEVIVESSSSEPSTGEGGESTTRMSAGKLIEGTLAPGYGQRF